MLELNELNIFLHAAEALSFTEAARRLHVSQPAVSMQISNLETRLDAALFDRSGRSISLTEAGESLLPLAREILNYASHIGETMASLHGQLIGNLRIGCSTAAGRYILPHLIARFRQQHPQVRVTVGICSPENAVDQVCDGRAQLGILSSEAGCREIEYRPFFEDRVVLIVPRDHPWAGQEAIRPQQLVSQPFILREETSGSRLVMQTGLLEHNIRLQDLDVVMELGSSEAIVTAVEAGIGIAFISRIVAQRCLAAGYVVQVPVQGLELRRSLHLVRHGRRPSTRIVTAFWDFVYERPNRLFLREVGQGQSPWVDHD